MGAVVRGGGTAYPSRMGDAAKARRTDAELRAALEALPEGQKGEILDGELYVQPRPRSRHARVNVSFAAQIGRVVDDFDATGSGSWIILVEPGIELPGAPEVAPDLAGWRRDRFEWPDDEPIRVVPDWVCEILSPSTLRVDRMKKMPIYARERVPHVWLVDPRERTVEVFRFGDPRYTLIGTFGGDDALVAEPFDATPIPPAFLWGAKAPVGG